MRVQTSDSLFRMYPIMALSDDRTKLENKNDMPMNVTAPVTGADYWILVNLTRSWNQSWTTRDGVRYPTFNGSITPWTQAGNMELYGPVDAAVPNLAVGEGVIPAGAISLTL